MAECSLGADSLPLLALTLARMYQDYGDDRKLSLAEYEAMGGMRQVVQIEIDQILSPILITGGLNWSFSALRSSRG